MSLKSRLTDDMKAAMRAGDKSRLGTIRMALAAIKQREVDERIELTDADVLALVDKMLKQRKDSFEQFTQAGRDDLAAQEKAEMEVLSTYLPEQLSEQEISQLIDQAIAESGAQSMQDMGKVMGLLKPQVQGRADMGQISGQVRGRLT
ncbi:MAG: aspartyl-tRNA amidotransferase subunit B [Lysobacteraceae bacterium]|nr:MAG: aspartyl-tRNA amidotransferase subunit B [Xanthomonadaceae bacterium]